MARIGSDETLRTASIAALELLELEEGLDREEVDAAAFEHRGLLGEDLGALGAWNVPGSPSGPIEPAMKTSRPAISRASRASLTPVAVDLEQLVLEVVGGELAAVGAERVRLDQVGAGLDEADVELDDGLGRAQVGLFRAAERGSGARDEDAHAAVGDERRARRRAVRGSGWPSAEPTSGARPGWRALACFGGSRSPPSISAVAPHRRAGCCGVVRAESLSRS